MSFETRLVDLIAPNTLFPKTGTHYDDFLLFASLSVTFEFLLLTNIKQ